MQLFNRRERFLKSENERKYWKQLDYRYMSQESSEDEDGSMVYLVHSPAWRSEGSLRIFHRALFITKLALNSLIKKLDKRSETLTKKRGFLRYKRKYSDCWAKSVQPLDAPSWTCKQEGMIYLFNYFL